MYLGVGDDWFGKFLEDGEGLWFVYRVLIEGFDEFWVVFFLDDLCVCVDLFCFLRGILRIFVLVRKLYELEVISDLL